MLLVHVVGVHGRHIVVVVVVAAVRVVCVGIQVIAVGIMQMMRTVRKNVVIPTVDTSSVVGPVQSWSVVVAVVVVVVAGVVVVAITVAAAGKQRHLQGETKQRAQRTETKERQTHKAPNSVLRLSESLRAGRVLKDSDL